MTWNAWKFALARALAHAFDVSTDQSQQWVEDGEDSYREMFDDGLSPDDACAEECDAAAWMAS